MPGAPDGRRWLAGSFSPSTGTGPRSANTWYPRGETPVSRSNGTAHDAGAAPDNDPGGSAHSIEVRPAMAGKLRGERVAA